MTPSHVRRWFSHFRTVGLPAVAIASVAVLAALGAGSLAAQETAGPLAPTGRLRIDVTPSFHSWRERFGLRTVDGALVEEREPLGFDLTDETGVALFPAIATLQTQLRTALADPNLDLRLGNARTHVELDVTRIPIRLDVGVTDWLTVGVTVPMVRTRTEVDLSFRADSANADLGDSPGRSSPAVVGAFLGELVNRVAALDGRIASGCPGDPGCTATRALRDELSTFRGALGQAYEVAPFFPVRGSAPALALGTRLSALNARLQDLGVGAVTASVPLASARLAPEELVGLVGGAGGDYQLRGLVTRQGLWQLGDVEVSAAARLLDGGAPDSAGAAPRLRFQVGAQALVRLGTGPADDPDDALDLGSGDGTTDVEVGAFTNLQLGRFGIWGDARFGKQGSTTLIRRVVPADHPFAPSYTRRSVQMTPGGYLQIEASPRYHVSDELAVVASYRVFSKAEDEFEELQPGIDDEDPCCPQYDATVLAAESEVTLHEAGIGLVFSTMTAWREGRAGTPFELRVGTMRAIGGSGGQTPAGFRVQAGVRLFRRLWGS